ncbi:MAG: hypothetical protein AB7G15_11420 [Alphaproteobacteria bacterium]
MILPDHARHWIKQRIASYGMRARVPFPAVKAAMNLVDVSARPIDTVRRKALARRRIEASRWAHTVPRDRGYARIEAGSFPGLDRFVEAGRDIYRRRAKLLAPRQGDNPFQSLLVAEDFRDYPALINTVLSEPVLDSAIGYFGTVPRLMYLDLWVTRPNVHEKLFSSQLYHLDQPESRILSLFVNVFDVAPENGPFLFLPAETSRQVCSATNYTWMETFGDGRLSDEQVFSHSRREDEISLHGGAGNAGFVDTSMCLHAGSRCRAGERVMLVIRFMPAYRTGFLYDDMFRLAAIGDDPIHRLVVPSAGA